MPKEPSIKDVAELANVSTTSVSYYLNGKKKLSDETVKRIEAAIAELNYDAVRAGRHHSTGATRSIGVLTEDLSSPVVYGILNGLTHTMMRRSFVLLLRDLELRDDTKGQNLPDLQSSKAKINENCQLLFASHIDGFIYVGRGNRNIDGIFDYIERPVVYCCSRSKDRTCVILDNVNSTKEMTLSMVGRRHTRIAVITGPEASLDAGERLEGYRMAMQEAFLPVNEAYVRHGDWTAESGRAQAEALLKLPEPPTAIVAMSDAMAYGVMQKAAEMGFSVPGDLAVGGFGNEDYAELLTPGLTSMELPLSEIGEKAAELCMTLIRNPVAPIVQSAVSAHMVWRGSI